MVDNVFDFLEFIENYIYVEVWKFYLDVEFFIFEINFLGDNIFEMIYIFERVMFDFVEGLMEWVIGYYGEEVIIEKKKLSEDGKKV